MVQVFPYALFCYVGMNAADDQISGRAYANLVRDMARQYKLAVVPIEFELQMQVRLLFRGCCENVPSCHAHRCRCVLHKP